jgi:L-ascorbate metabolism protein UlaG (beta-lactamase superfamily)
MSELRVTRIAHSCHLIELAGVRLLTDPWFTSTPTYHPGEPVAMTVADLPDLDAVLISHEHYDHCDLDALAGYRDLDVPVFAPSTVVARARERGFPSVHVMDVWQTASVGAVAVTAAPGKHGVPEITFVLQGGGVARRVAEAGDGDPAPLRVQQRLARQPDDHFERP